MGATETQEGPQMPESADIALHTWQPHPELPTWFNTFRAAAREVYVDNDLPVHEDEAWHYGDPKRYLLSDVAVEAVAGHPGGRAAKLNQLAEMNVLATVAGWSGGLQFTSLGEEDNLKGLRLGMLSDMQRLGQADAVKSYWTDQAPRLYGNKLAGAHYALASDPLVLVIPRNHNAYGPVVINMDAGRAGTVSAPQLLIVAGEHSRAEVILTVSSESAAERQLILASTRSYVASGANLKLCRLQHLGDKTDALTWEQVDVSRDGLYTSVNAAFGGRNVRLEAVANLREPGSTAHLFSGCLTRGRQRYDFLTHQNHLAPNANSNLLYKSALLDKSRVSYQGTITVHPGAQKTDAYQKNRSLVLSPQARSDSSPQLEIKADDVRCSHGSTTSNVSPAELFYLRSRGISEHDARQLLVEGFLGEIAAHFTSQEMRSYISELVLEQV